MADTFDAMARSLRLFVPQLPYTLARQIIRDRYRRILERRTWSGLRGEGEFILNVQKVAGTVAVTRSSLTVTGTGAGFASTDVGRQFKLGAGSAIYTIATVNVGGQTLTLDRVYSGDNATAQAYTIFDGYITAPADFKSFIAVIDHTMGWRLRTWITQDELNAWDPQRTFFGQPYVVADRRYNAGVPSFEAWPYTTTNRALHYLYFQLGSDLAQDDDVPIYPIRSDAIVSGAMADVCRWPGTAQQPNLLFGKMDIYRSYELECEDKLVEIERADENVYLTWLATTDFASLPYAPLLSTNYAFSHA